jgi:menaquinone-dependent protoporphyrinogen oxidase
MARVLIAYGTVEGHTARIADEMRVALSEAGHHVRLFHVREHGENRMPEEADAVIVGAPIHGGHHPKEIVAFAKANRLRLGSLPSGFFTVCLTAADDTPEARESTAEYVQGFCDATGWTPRHTAVFAGRLAWTQYDLFTRVIMKLITHHHGVPDQDTKRDYDYTDYAAVRRFALDVAAAAEREPVG